MTGMTDRWQGGPYMPPDFQMMVGAGQRTYFMVGEDRIEWDEAVVRGYIENVPWPDPDTIGSFL